MGIKKKKKGVVPYYPERWQNIATNPERLSEARHEYRVKNPKATLVEAHRAVSAFAREHKSRYG